MAPSATSTPTPTRRRLSYAIPAAPVSSAPRLQVPSPSSRLRSASPLLVPYPPNDALVSPLSPPPQPPHPRHRLGVVSLALDTSTQLLDHTSPEGMLYTGGRDGLVISWDLGIPMKRRTQHYGLASTGALPNARCWEYMTGWADDTLGDDDDDPEAALSDGDILGDVKGSARRRRGSTADLRSIPPEDQWETDVDMFSPGKHAQFRQSTQAHTDWINDILLCNSNQTLVSASSDGSIKAWNPHDNLVLDPVTVGLHDDYVRCLAQSRAHNWVASGSFDRTIKLWDLDRSAKSNGALLTLKPPESSGPKASIYALAADPLGHTIVSGGPERVIRIWDPRAGKRIGKLVGHTDNIRSILISNDSRYLLTASADASIKLWSLSSQRCLHTFTHHTDSVWSLHSTHPSLQIFYSGDKSGYVSKVDVEGCTDMSEGECVVICQDTNEQGSSEGVVKIVAMDDNLVWTASGSSSLKRWRVPKRRVVRAASLTAGIDNLPMTTRSESPDATSSTLLTRRGSRPDTITRSLARSLTVNVPSHRLPHVRLPHHSHSVGSAIQLDKDNSGEEGVTTWYGLPFESLVRLTSPHDPFAPFSATTRQRDADVATLYSAASVHSVPHPPPASDRRPLSPLQSVFPPSTGTSSILRTGSPVQSEKDYSSREDGLLPKTARAEFEKRDVVADATPIETTPDDIIQGGTGLVRAVLLNNRMHALTVDNMGDVAVWDIVRCVCVGRIAASDICAAAATFDSSVSANGSAGSSMCGGGSVSAPNPREALELVRERIEGEAVVLPWCTVDTKVGILAVHLNDKCFESELYADEAGISISLNDRQRPEDQRVNLGKWMLRNLFLGFVREEQRLHSPRRPQENLSPSRQLQVVTDGDSPLQSPNSAPHSATTPSSPTNSTIFNSPTLVRAVSPRINPSPRTVPPIATKFALHQPLSPIIQSPSGGLGTSDTTPRPGTHARAATDVSNPSPVNLTANNSSGGDYFTMRVHRPSVSSQASDLDEFSGWAGPGLGAGGKNGDSSAALTTPLTPSSGGGIIGRLKTLGKISKRPQGDATPTPRTPGTSGGPSASPTIEGANLVKSVSPSPAQAILAGPITPPSSADGPTVALPSTTPIIISEEQPAGWSSIYQGTVASTSRDVAALEDTMPLWLLEYLLLGKAPPVQVTKIGFVLLPYQPREPGEEPLPELLNTSQSKLTASRFLRVRKLTVHVQDKIDKMAATSNTIASRHNTPRSSLDTHSITSGPRGGPGAGDVNDERAVKPEDTWEILCNDVPLPLDMTLAAVRQYVWKQTYELVMHYRRRRTAVPSGSLAPTNPSQPISPRFP